MKAKYSSADGLSMGVSSNFTIEEVEAIRAELFNIQQSLSTGEQEKVELMKNLACLKDDLTRLQPSSSGQVSLTFFVLVCRVIGLAQYEATNVEGIMATP